MTNDPPDQGNASLDAQLDEAVDHHRAIEIRPEYAKAHFNLGNALNETGRQEAAFRAMWDAHTDKDKAS